MQPVELYDIRYKKMFLWAFTQTGKVPPDIANRVVNIWWLQTGMAIALKHPEYAQVWLAGDPSQHWDFMQAADSFVEAVPLEAKLPEAG